MYVCVYVHVYLPGTQQHKTAAMANAKLIPMEIQLTSAFIFNKSANHSNYCDPLGMHNGVNVRE